jgi:amidase/aspartyl-tRNA(Asn)/glutamyl-tRNA(Gln) amidotransferase subunit A
MEPARIEAHVDAAAAALGLPIAPATPCVAPLIGSEILALNRRRLPTRASLGLLTQPVSFIGLPVCAVPIAGVDPAPLIGVQIVAAPWREDLVLRVARHLERAGLARAPVAHPEEAS